MARPDWMVGCPTSLSGLHLYEQVKSPSKEDSALCSSCRHRPDHSELSDVLTFIENAKKELAGERRA